MVVRRVLTLGQACSLHRGVVDTILPGSEDLNGLIRASIASPRPRNNYILKPIRSGKGDGIVFGDDIGRDERVSALQKLVSPKVVPGITCVVQRRTMPCEYDLVLKRSVGRVHYPLFRTYPVA